MSLQLSIVVPVYQSAGCLAELASRVASELVRVPGQFELILVNDCSRDGSWGVIERLAEEHDFVVGLNLRKNVGQDNAILAGMSVSTGDVVVIMDDDLQHDPADILRLCEQVRAGYDVAYAHFGEKQQAGWKNLGSWLADRVAVILLDKPKGLYMSPFKALDRTLVDEILRARGPYGYVDGIILTLTRNYCQIPATHHTRFTGSSNYNLIRSIGVGLTLATGYSVVPLRLVSLAGALIAVFSFLMGTFFLIQRFVSDFDVEGWAALMVSISFLGGIQLLGIGTLGEYLGRMYLTVNEQPKYSIRNRCGRATKD